MPDYFLMANNLRKDNEKLINIIDELERYLLSYIAIYGENNNIYFKIYNKLNELKGDNK